MTQEEKDLLLRDLCGRLRYGVYISPVDSGKAILIGIKDGNPLLWDTIHKKEYDKPWDIEYIKPYLRPLSSMTKEERHEMEKVIGSNPIEPFGTLTDTCDNLVRSCAYGSYLMLQYLYSHHFDVVNLIEKGLALEAPEGMYK